MPRWLRCSTRAREWVRLRFGKVKKQSEALPVEQRLASLVARYSDYEHPEVEPQLMHFRQEPFRTIVMAPHSVQESPS